MMNKGVAIRYGDVAPEAKENFAPSASESQFDTLDQLQQYNLDFPNFANPCELYSVVLDGEAVAFPSDTENKNFGLWSEQISKDNGTFETPIVLTLQSVGQYSSQGLTLTFDTQNGIYANRIKITWSRVVDGSETVLSEKEFAPNNASFFCYNPVKNYNLVVVTFYSINMPKNRLKFRAIDYGYGTVFYGNELRNVRLIQEIDPISSQISINTADFTLDSKSEIIYSFQAKQPLSVYFNGELKATTFVKSSKRTAKKLWTIQSEDYVGLLDSIPYYGGIYTESKAVDVLTDIFSVAKVPYQIDSSFSSAKITGHIPYTTCRNALMQVSFAIQAVVDTSNSDVVRVYALENDLKQTIPLKRIMQGQNFADEETVTGVELTVHAFKAVQETVDAYDANESGTGNDLFVRFSEPLHGLTIENGDIVTSNANYAIINARSGCILRGKKYDHTTQTKRKNNPVVLASEIEKIVAITNATLVSSTNANSILDSCYDWLTKVNSVNLKIVEGKHVQEGGLKTYGSFRYGEAKYGEKTKSVITYDDRVNVGDVLNAETEFLGVVSGRLIKQSFNLNGGIIVKEAVLR
jgi:hypothetical protein